MIFNGPKWSCLEDCNLRDLDPGWMGFSGPRCDEDVGPLSMKTHMALRIYTCKVRTQMPKDQLPGELCSMLIASKV